ncbi:SHD1 domain-containing protein [Rubripirellula sp.]|nr:SHD1 domain-containing protein [Rubripirellula sp.]
MLSMLTLCVAAFTLAGSARAETWTDNTGKFQIEADFSGVNGKNLVLKKADGSTIEVPINRLSAASHARAKELYAASKGGGTAAPTAPAAAMPVAPAIPAVPAASPNANPNFKVPVAPAVAPLPAFPENATLQATVDFCRDQLMAGHPEVFWQALPEDMRQMMDSQEFRSTLAESLKSQKQTMTQVEGLFQKLAQVLVTQKKYVMNTPMLMQAVPPGMMPMVQQGYDPAVGTVYELGMLIFDLPSIDTQTMSEMMDSHGPKLGGHLKGIVAMLPPGMAQQAMAGIAIQQTDDNHGTLTMPGEEATEMVRYMDRWMPKDMFDEWQAKKGSMLSEMKTELAAAQQGEQVAQANMMAGMMITMVGGILDPMLAAKSQAEFDQALMQIMQLAPMLGLGGGGGPAGGFPGGPGGPGFPGEPIDEEPAGPSSDDAFPF